MTLPSLAERRMAFKVLFWFSAAVAAIFTYWSVEALRTSSTRHGVVVACSSLIIVIVSGMAMLFTWMSFRAISLVSISEPPAPAPPLQRVGVNFQVTSKGKISVEPRWTPDPQTTEFIDSSLRS